LEACKLLVGHGSMYDFVDENGETPLFYAIKSNRIEILNYLLSLGCNMQIVN
jgi:ankyrin repeat protein